MSPNCELSGRPSASRRFVPSLACIAEEEPKVVAYRRITVPDVDGHFFVKIPIFDVNIYSPRPPQEPLPASYQRLLAEMDKFIGTHKRNSEQHKMMAKSLRQKVALEQAEKRRLSPPNFTDRDWYWYAEQTGNFVDEPMTGNAKLEKIDNSSIEKSSESLKIAQEPVQSTVEIVQDDIFDLSADF